MNEMNGNQALKHIREAQVNVPIVMLSSVTDQNLVSECEGYGISGFIFKPIQADSGVDLIKRYLKIE